MYRPSWKKYASEIRTCGAHADSCAGRSCSSFWLVSEDFAMPFNQEKEMCMEELVSCFSYDRPASWTFQWPECTLRPEEVWECTPAAPL